MRGLDGHEMVAYDHTTSHNENMVNLVGYFNTFPEGGSIRSKVKMGEG